MTVEEALPEPGRKPVAPRDEHDGQRMESIYGLASGGAKEVATQLTPVGEHDALVASLVARGCEKAETESLTRIIWIPAATGVEVFDKRKQQLDADGDRATLEDGRIINRSDLVRV